LMSLCGIVVRNAIILVDYIKEKQEEGHSLEQAATEAGERRLRPIFLTTMAAAVGVTPMILSGSNMWGPLASVIAVGLVTVPAGALGTIPGQGPFPTHNTTLNQGSSTLLLESTTLSQPLTQLFKIRESVKVAAANQRITEAELKKAEDDVALGVHQLYYGLLAASKQVGAMQAQIEADQETLREVENDVRAGNSLEVKAIAGRAALLKSRQALLAAENQVSDLTAEMDDLLGLPSDTELELAEVVESSCERLTHEQYLKVAFDHNAELWAATETVSKARSAVMAAKYEYIPNVGAFARETYQNGVPFMTHNFGTFGLQMNWSVFDWGKKKGVVGEREAQLTQAEENLRRIRDRITVDVEKAYRKLERTKMMVDVAQEALVLRKEGDRISGDQLKAGLTSDAKKAEAVAATRGAEVDELQARLSYELALAEIARITGWAAR